VLGIVIPYCTNDYRFLGKCLAEVRKFAHQIVVVVCDHFFNGTVENRALLNQTYAEHPDCQFVEFAYTPGKLYSPYSIYLPEDEGWIRLLHSQARYIGLLHMERGVEFVMFLDCDEIPEGDRVAAWLKTGEYKKWNAMRLRGYYYALRANLRATRMQDVALIVRRACLGAVAFLQPDERAGIYYRQVAYPKKNEVVGLDGQPMFHHYSWVRPREECVRKSESWGHREEKDWRGEIKRAFNEEIYRNLFGTVNVDFKEVDEVFFDPLKVVVPSGRSGGQFPHVKKVGPRDILRMEIDEIC